MKSLMIKSVMVVVLFRGLFLFDVVFDNGKYALMLNLVPFFNLVLLSLLQMILLCHIVSSVGVNLHIYIVYVHDFI